MNSARAVRGARKRAGLSQAELARRTGIPQPAISRIERGLVVPRADTLDRLLEACGEGLEALPRPGLGVDRTVTRALLGLSPGERSRIAVIEAANLQRALPADRRG